MSNRTKQLKSLLAEKILIIDGAMGTMIQKHKLQEADYRGMRFKDYAYDLKGNNDLLCLTQPHIIKDIHKQYLAAGTHIIETNTFNAQAVSLEDYKMQDLATEINIAAATIAQQAVDEFVTETKANKGELFVAGAIGPMNKTLSLSPDVNNPGYRAVTFDEVANAYYEQVSALIQGGVDILLVETIFDTLNAKAAIFSIKRYFKEHNIELPVMISGTITDASGRTLSGQTLEAFYISMMHVNPVSIGLNCALGAKQMRPHIEELARLAACFVSAYPNAGLPNTMGEYDETPEEMAITVGDFARQGWINLMGGCCGTTPEHIEAIKNEMKKYAPRLRPEMETE